jgi:hypothetical protein
VSSAIALALLVDGVVLVVVGAELFFDRARPPLDLDSASRWLHLPIAVASPVFLVFLLAWRGGLGRAAGALLVGLYVAYVAAAVIVSLS